MDRVPLPPLLAGVGLGLTRHAGDDEGLILKFFIGCDILRAHRDGEKRDDEGDEGQKEDRLVHHLVRSLYLFGSVRFGSVRSWATRAVFVLWRLRRRAPSLFSAEGARDLELCEKLSFPGFFPGFSAKPSEPRSCGTSVYALFLLLKKLADCQRRCCGISGPQPPIFAF